MSAEEPANESKMQANECEVRADERSTGPVFTYLDSWLFWTTVSPLNLPPSYTRRSFLFIFATDLFFHFPQCRVEAGDGFGLAKPLFVLLVEAQIFAIQAGRFLGAVEEKRVSTAGRGL